MALFNTNNTISGAVIFTSSVYPQPTTYQQPATYPTPVSYSPATFSQTSHPTTTPAPVTFEGGFDAHFESPLPSDLTCPICMSAFREPIQTECGHQFCRSCIDNSHPGQEDVEDGGGLLNGFTCPVDRQPLDTRRMFPDNNLKRKVLSLKVACGNSETINVACGNADVACGNSETTNMVCSNADEACVNAETTNMAPDDTQTTNVAPDDTHMAPDDTQIIDASDGSVGNVKHTCSWQGELRHLEDHKSVCELASVSCPNCGCFERILRKHLDHHVNDACDFAKFICNFCEVEMLRKDVAVHHEVACTRYPTPCVQGCGLVDVPRGDMETHINQHCPLTVLNCCFIKYGCKFRGAKVEREEHFKANMEDHLRIVIDKSSEYEGRIVELESKVRQLECTAFQERNPYYAAEAVPRQCEYYANANYYDSYPAYHAPYRN